MKNNVYKFPESLDRTCRISYRKYENLTAEMRKINIFAGGFFLGSSLTLIIVRGYYYFLGLIV